MPPSARACAAPVRSLHAPTAVGADSPVFRFHHADNTPRAINGSGTHTQHSGPWTTDEHERFLQALEQYGCGQSASVASAWHAIAAAIATRSVADVKAHANRYYAQLQAVNAQRRKEHLARQQLDTRWTLREDEQLEDELASHIPVRVAYPWDTIARRVPGKTPRDVRERYHKLCYDVSRIESGQHVMMHLSRHGQPATTNNGHGNHVDEGDVVDCVVALTPQETQLLLSALDRVPVPPHASPDVLAAVASGVALLACNKHRQPPRRTVAQFSLEDARFALEQAIHAKLRDPVDVLELLASELQLRPLPPLQCHQQQESQHTETKPIDRSRRYDRPPVYGDFSWRREDTVGSSPSRSRSSSFVNSSRTGEELLTHLKTSPVHDPRRTREARRRRQPQQREFSSGAFPLPTHAASSFPYSLMPSAASTHGGGYNDDNSDRWHPHRHYDDSFNDYF